MKRLAALLCALVLLAALAAAAADDSEANENRTLVDGSTCRNYMPPVPGGNMVYDDGFLSFRCPAEMTVTLAYGAEYDAYAYMLNLPRTPEYNRNLAERNGKPVEDTDEPYNLLYFSIWKPEMLAAVMGTDDLEELSRRTTLSDAEFGTRTISSVTAYYRRVKSNSPAFVDYITYCYFRLPAGGIVELCTSENSLNADVMDLVLDSMQMGDISRLVSWK